jgi:hypothetical protein
MCHRCGLGKLSQGTLSYQDIYQNEHDHVIQPALQPILNHVFAQTMTLAEFSAGDGTLLGSVNAKKYFRISSILRSGYV